MAALTHVPFSKLILWSYTQSNETQSRTQRDTMAPASYDDIAFLTLKIDPKNFAKSV